MKSLKGKTAVITGAGGSIGLELARRLYKEGCYLVLIDRKNILNPLKKEFVKRTDFWPMDLRNTKDEFGKLLRKSSFSWPKIDYLFNVAGVGIYNDAIALTFKDWEDSININLSAPFYLSYLLFFHLNSMILNIGSGMGVFPTAHRSAYCASKFGLRGLSLSMSKEIKKLDVVLLTLGSVMDNFGDGIETRKMLQKEGKHYLSVKQVVDKIIKITKSDKRRAEYVLYPKGYSPKTV
jgi:3-oxoacyl-[acyl-carrier protein] reductase